MDKVHSRLTNGEFGKLNKRANKAKSRNRFVPSELLDKNFQIEKFNEIINFIKHHKIETNVALILLSLNYLVKAKILSKINIYDIIHGKKLIFTNHQIENEINSWFVKIENKIILPDFSFLLNCEMFDQKDILGIFYQTLLFEGEKSKTGSYYTPTKIVDDISKEYLQKTSKVLDPCCGTGQFLMSFANVVNDPTNIYGIDCDDIAIRIARLNILVKF